MTIGRSNSEASDTRSMRILKCRVRPEQRQKLLWAHFARRRPQPRSSAAAHDQGNNTSVHPRSNL